MTGGCQCGAVRYALQMTPQKTHYCHCRMCQRAVGNAFALLTGVAKGKLEFTRGAPAYFNSSSLARRGFCRDCGTPLSFDYNRSDWIYVTVGSLDEPQRVAPEKHYGIESQIPWLHIEDNLSREQTNQNDAIVNMTIHQHPPAAQEK
jgi:hypothetical protein